MLFILWNLNFLFIESKLFLLINYTFSVLGITNFHIIYVKF